MQPKVVYHYTRRGRDHTKVAGGLDLRAAKNITVLKRTTTPDQVVNRLLLLGYGTDRTQLVYEARSLIDAQGRLPSDPYYRYDTNDNAPSSAAWDKRTGGTSEEIYGPRYGTYRDANVLTLFRAQEVASAIVEKSAWPLESYEIQVVDLADIPAKLTPGDTVRFPYKGRDLVRRIVDFTTDVEKPRSLNLTLGEDVQELAHIYDRIAKDLDAIKSAINQQPRSAAEDPALRV